MSSAWPKVAVDLKRLHVTDSDSLPGYRVRSGISPGGSALKQQLRVIQRHKPQGTSRLSRGKQKRKHTFSFFFQYLFSNTNRTYTYSLRLLCRSKGHAHIIMNTGSRLKNDFNANVLLRSHFSLITILMISTRRIVLP